MNSVKGLVVAKHDINEADALLHVLCENEKITLKAKGINKINSKNARGCQLYAYTQFHLIEKNAKTTHLIQNVEVIENFRHIREDLLLLTLASCMMEAIDKMNWNETDLSLTECLAFLRSLDQSKHPYCVFALFLSRVLDSCGIACWSNSCVHCFNEHQICGISISEGGFICARCFDARKHIQLSAFQLRQLRYITHAKLSDLNVLEDYGPWTYDIVDVLLKLLDLHGEFKMNGAEFLRHLNGVNH